MATSLFDMYKHAVYTSQNASPNSEQFLDAAIDIDTLSTHFENITDQAMFDLVRGRTSRVEFALEIMEMMLTRDFDPSQLQLELKDYPS